MLSRAGAATRSAGSVPSHRSPKVKPRPVVEFVLPLAYFRLSHGARSISLRARR